MADRHRNRIVATRMPDDLRSDLQAAAAERGMTLTALLIAFSRWWLRMPGAKLPPRPPR